MTKVISWSVESRFKFLELWRGTVLLYRRNFQHPLPVLDQGRVSIQATGQEIFVALQLLQ